LHGKPDKEIRRKFVIESAGRKCTRCFEFLSWDNFSKGRGPNGKTTRCRKCCSVVYKENLDRHVAHGKKNWIKNRDRYLGQRRYKEYGISPDAAQELFASQQGICPPCGEPIEFSKAVLDHDHKTGRVRGFIHHRCNSALGIFADNANGLFRAYQYLLDSENKNVKIEAPILSSANPSQYQ